jgi:hypothetical protein
MPESDLTASNEPPKRIPYPKTDDLVAWSDDVTQYDLEHTLAYARMLNFEWEFADWQAAARGILLIDPDKDPEKARLCWESHLARAKWVATTGFQLAIARAEAS